ncbi:MAG TPA: phosphoribosylformylglycinamidine cyclo-ligase [Nitrososphaeraceae archaeon]|nr:phosphoribosylformylglycinamidine cyclo-ligase [Nitrososphaeraceae archaeon]
MKSNNKMTYNRVGIDLKKIRRVQKSIGDIISATHSFPALGKVISGFGHYAGLIDIGSKVLALHSDGVGTKVIVAQLMGRFDSIGIDCIAMNVNDIICVGAQPLAFIDYIALKAANDDLVRKITKGLVKGAKQSDMAIIGGETAVLPDLISDTSENAFDLAGTVLGVTEKPNLILGDKIKTGDIILGVESSGLHSNGYTLARKVLLSKYTVEDTAPYLIHTVGEELLVPTTIYKKPVMDILKQKYISIHGIAHITGGSFAKLTRLNTNVDYKLDNLPDSHGIFKQIQADGHIETKEMYRTFNMGVGFCIILQRRYVDPVISIFEKYNMTCTQIGMIPDKRKNKYGRVIAKIDGRNVIL